MFKRFIRILSFVLIISLLWNMLPVSVLGAELRAAQDEADTPVALEPGIIEETEQPEDIIIIGELTDRRTENIKEYLLSNGNTLAAVYGTPVHYQKDGQWKDIDNTLTAKADGTYINTAGAWDVSFPQTLSSANRITITKDGYTLSFGMAGQLRQGNAVIRAGENVLYATEAGNVPTLTVSAASVSQAQIQQVDLTEAKAAAKHPQLVQEKLASRLAYSQVYANTDIVYDLDANRVKESVILSQYDSTLRGYRYTLNTGGMIPVLGDDGHIDFYDTQGEEIVMTMPAPFLVDANFEYNWAVEVTLTGSGNTYTLTYTLPQQWLAAEDRAWPVVLDPVVNVNNSGSVVADQTVFNITSKDPTWGMIQCGYSTTTGISRFYLAFKSLPTLTSADVIVDAQVTLHKAVDSSNTIFVGVHSVNSTWASSGITWANKPGFGANVSDFAIVQESGTYTWDVTDIARGWYETGVNTGMMFKSTDAIETQSTSSRYAQFYSSDYGTNKPALTLEYRNTSGLEDYWDYASASAGRAGTAYVNAFSGNLVWVHSDMGFDGNLMPVSISHIYNADDAWNMETSTGINTFGMGYGWRTNYNQTIVAASGVDGTTYYIWEDGDGTTHEFYANANGIYKDIDDLGLTLTVTTTEYTIKDKYDNTSKFDASGRLIQQSNNQQTQSSINIYYVNTTGNLIDRIVDGAGRTYKFSYNSSNLLTQIAYYGTYAVGACTPFAVVSFEYTSTKLTKITYADGAYSTFSYTTKNMLSYAKDVDGYKIEFGYNTLGSKKPSRVVSIIESDGDNLGASTTIAYYYQHTRLTDYNENTKTYFFNEWGNTTSVQDSEGNAVFYQYDTDIRNRLISVSQEQGTTINYLSDSSFENETEWSELNSSSTRCYSTSDESYDGAYSLASYCSIGQNVMGAYCGGFTVADGESYTFSAYMITEGGTAALRIRDDTGTNANSKATSSGSDWTRLETTYTNNTGEPRTILLCIYHLTTGIAYIDCVQLEKNAAATQYNRVEDGDFEFNLTSANSPWNIYNAGSTNTPSSSQELSADSLTSNVIYISGDPFARQYVYQTVDLYGVAGDRYVFSGWVKADPLPDDGSDRFCGLVLVFNNSDGTKTEFKTSANPNLVSGNQWQHLATAAVANKSYHSITVRAEFSYNANTAYFDDLQLYEGEFGETYTYDGNGNVTAVRDVLGLTTTYTYNASNDVIKLVTPNGITTTYDVSNHNVTGALERYYNSDGSYTNLASYIYYYNSYGNQYGQSVTMGDFVRITSATYSSDQNHLVSTVDELGNTTTYHYNPDTSVLEWVRYPNDTDATRTNYTYDAMYRLDGISTTTDQGREMSTTYTYNENDDGDSIDNDYDALTQIATETTTYSFAYGDFALRTQASIGNRILAAYTYSNDNNKYLKILEYGNSDRVEYIYDNQGRVVMEKYYEDGATTDSRDITYIYDNMGMLAMVVDPETGVATKYYYDTIGRNTGMYKYGGSSTQRLSYTYDELGRLQTSKETIDSTAYTTEYSYDDIGQIHQVKAGDSKEVYVYDACRRLDHWSTYHGNSDSHLIYKVINFVGLDERSTSDRISVLNYSTSGTFNRNYTFTYDGNGNIVRVTQTGGKNTYYHYDSANQLIREDNEDEGKTWVWTYDGAGNIQSKTEYAYTTGALDNDGITIDYIYGNTEWGDLLTSYNGKSFSYDNIGNLTSDGTWNYTWAQGRQLATMAKSGTTWTFTYDANGMRTERTTGSTSSTYTYTYHGSKLTHMTYGSNSLHFYYDASGKPLSVVHNGTTYYYILSLQGDVVAILNSSGAAVVEYTYDAWGRLLRTNDVSGNNLGALNPLRYRGYVYDQETGLYYLQSRYYNPAIGRFISADNYPSTGQGLTGNNMFAYCGNNPVARADEGGECWHLVIGAVVGVVTQYAVDVVTDWINGESITEILKPNSSIADYASAAISGALAASGIGIAGSIIANAALGGTTYYANCKINGAEVDGFDMFLATTIGGLSGAIGGSGVNGARLHGVVKTSKYVLNTAVSTARKNMYKGKIVSAIADVAIGTARTIGAGIFSNLANTGRKHLTGSFY